MPPGRGQSLDGWDAVAFVRAMSSAGQKDFGKDSLRHWLRRETIPDRDKVEAFLKVFYPNAARGDEVEQRQKADFQAACDLARSEKRGRSREANGRSVHNALSAGMELQRELVRWPNLPAKAESADTILSPRSMETTRGKPAEDWLLVATGHDFDRMVEFRLHQPDRWNTPSGSYGIKATLRFFVHDTVLEMPDERLDITLSLSSANLTVSASGYQIGLGGVIGSGVYQLFDHFGEFVPGGRKIVPLDNRLGLSFDALPHQDYVAMLEPLSWGPPRFTARVTATKNEIEVSALDNDIATSRKVRTLKEIINQTSNIG